jgi:hypothetical protein
VQSFTDQAVWYEIFLSEDQTVAKCSCKAFAKTGRDKECKHIKLLRAHFTNGNGQPKHSDEDSVSVAPSEEELAAQQAAQKAPADPEESSAFVTIPQQFLTWIHGKPFVQYAGLLAMAHDMHLKSLTVRFISVSDKLAVAEATATFANGKSFTEAADAYPANVHEKIRPHFMRMALTRAKARALRDALNIGICSVEEVEA